MKNLLQNFEAFIIGFSQINNWNQIEKLEDFDEKLVVLCLLRSKKKLSQDQIGDILGMNKSKVYRILNSLEEKKIVKRKMNKSNRRQNLITLLEKNIQFSELEN